MPATLKPNTSTLSQSWNSLSFTSRAMIIAASVVSLAGAIYAAWPVSKEAALAEAKGRLDEYKEIIKDCPKISNPKSIKDVFDQIENPTTFPFGPFWNRNAIQVLVEIENNQNVLIIKKKRVLKDEPLHLEKHTYDATKQKWIPDLFNAAMK